MMTVTKKEIIETSQYQTILEAFEKVLDLTKGSEHDIQYIVAVLASVRMERLMHIVSDELFLSYDYMIEILRKNIYKGADELKDHTALVVISAMENLLDFAICQEYKMMSEIEDLYNEDDEDDIQVDEDDVMDVFFKYNGLWATIEDNTVMQSAAIANMWGNLSSNSIMQFTTQRDERVRYSHSALDGYKAPKNDFPSELIPPIDYNCRCFLVNSGDGNFDRDESYVELERDLISKTNSVFAGSLATYGAIFGKSHSYFDIEQKDSEEYNTIKTLIRERFLENEMGD